VSAANAVMGEIAVKALGTTWIMVSGFSAMAQIEEEFDEPPMEVLLRLFPAISAATAQDPAQVEALAQKVRWGELRRVLIAMFRLHHPDIDALTIGRIVAAVGVDKTFLLVLKAIEEATPAVVAKPGGGANPPKPHRRRGGPTGAI